MKKYLALLLALVLAFGVVLTACGGDKAPETTAPKADAGNDATDAPDSTDAPTDAPVELRTIKVWGMDPVSGLEDHKWELFMHDEHKNYNRFLDEMEKIGIEFVPEAIDYSAFEQTASNRVNAILDLPDIINLGGAGYSQADIVKLGKSGVLVELTALFEEYDEDGSIMEWLMDFPTIGTIFDENGKMWYMPTINFSQLTLADGSYGMTSCYAFQMRYDWMQALGLEYKHFMTPDEVFNILKAFRDNDANGNGMADEVLRYTVPGDLSFAPSFGMGGNMIYSLSDGTVGCQIDHPNFKAMVEFYQKLFNEGIITPDQFNEGWDPVSANAGSGLLSYGQQTWEEPAIVGYEDTAYYAPVLVDDDGGENGFFLNYADAACGMGVGFGVNPDADLEAVVDFFDWMCSDEFIEWNRGIKGEQWDYDENGMVTNLIPVDERNDFIDGNLKNRIFGNWVPDFNKTFYTPESLYNYYVTTQIGDRYIEKLEFENEVIVKRSYGNFVYESSSPFYAMMTEAESEAYSLVANDVKTYWDELMVDLMTGEKSLDDLDTYRQQLTELGLDTMLKIQTDRAARYWSITG